jgi:TPP-dependent indolepyruvate ferredoxin oxidoreductase alpha subunit
MTTEERVARLEKQLRCWRWAAALAVVVAAGVAAKPGPKSIEAERLVIRDQEGRQRLILDTTWPRGDAYLQVNDIREVERASVGVMEGGSPYVSLYDANKKLRATLEVSPELGPVLDLYDAAGRETAELPRP